jgi:hypothetical protein
MTRGQIARHLAKLKCNLRALTALSLVASVGTAKLVSIPLHGMLCCGAVNIVGEQRRHHGWSPSGVRGSSVVPAHSVENDRTEQAERDENCSRPEPPTRSINGARPK